MVHVNTWVLTYDCTESSTKEVLLRPGRGRCPGKSMETIFGCRGINCNHRAVQRKVVAMRDVYVTFSAARFMRHYARCAALPFANHGGESRRFYGRVCFVACRPTFFRPAHATLFLAIPSVFLGRATRSGFYSVHEPPLALKVTRRRAFERSG